jgi:hypothetical protein
MHTGSMFADRMEAHGRCQILATMTHKHNVLGLSIKDCKQCLKSFEIIKLLQFV